MATYASKAATGYLGTFSTGSPPAAIAEIVSMKGNFFEIPPVDVSHLQSPNATREYAPGLLKPGTVDFTAHLTGDSSQLDITTTAQANAAQSPSTIAFSISCKTNSGTQTYTASGKGFIAGYEIGPIELDKPIEIMGKFQITGAVTEAVA